MKYSVAEVKEMDDRLDLDILSGEIIILERDAKGYLAGVGWVPSMLHEMRARRDAMRKSLAALKHPFYSQDGKRFLRYE